MGCGSSTDIGDDRQPKENSFQQQKSSFSHNYRSINKVNSLSPSQKQQSSKQSNKLSIILSFRTINSPKSLSSKVSPSQISKHSFQLKNSPLTEPSPRKYGSFQYSPSRNPTTFPPETPRFIKEYMDRMSSTSSSLSPKRIPVEYSRTELSSNEKNIFLPQSSITTSNFISSYKKRQSPIPIPIAMKGSPVNNYHPINAIQTNETIASTISTIYATNSSDTNSPKILSLTNHNLRTFSFRGSPPLPAPIGIPSIPTTTLHGKIVHIQTEDYSFIDDDDDGHDNIPCESLSNKSQEMTGKKFSFLDSLKGLEDRRASLQRTRSFASRRTSTVSDAGSLEDIKDRIILHRPQSFAKGSSMSDKVSSKIELLANLERDYVVSSPQFRRINTKEETVPELKDDTVTAFEYIYAS